MTAGPATGMEEHNERVGLSSSNNSSARKAGAPDGKGGKPGVLAALTGGFRAGPDLPRPVLHYSWLSVVLLGACGFQFAGATGALAAVLAACGAVLFLLGASSRAVSAFQTILPAKLLFAISVVGAAFNGLPLILLAPVALLLPAAEAAAAAPRRAVVREAAFGAFAALAAVLAGYFSPLPSASPQLAAALAAAMWGGFLMRVLLVRSVADEQQDNSDDIWRVVADGPQVMILVAKRSGEVLRMLDPSHEVLGIAPFLLTGQAFLERVHLTDRVALLDALDTVCTRGGHKQLSARIRLPGSGDGQEIVYREFLIAVASRAEPGTALVTVREADRAPELEQRICELETGQGELEVAKSRFLASASHELRTPLNAIIGFADLLLMQPGGELAADQQRDYVGLIRASGQHLLSVVNTILDMSRIETGNYAIAPTRFGIADVVDMSKSMVDQAAIERGIAFDIDIDADCAELLADQRAVQQIVINLLSNAVKFTGEGGRVRVSTERYANWKRIAITDTGIGMDAGFLEKVGTPFLQADNDYTRRHEGTGLGLSVVRGLMELHGGTMEVESAPFEGTTVTVSFPADGPVASYGATAQVTEIAEMDERERGYDDGCRKSA